MSLDNRAPAGEGYVIPYAAIGEGRTFAECLADAERTACSFYGPRITYRLDEVIRACPANEAYSIRTIGSPKGVTMRHEAEFGFLGRAEIGE